jgi:putative aldouronate transport system substrate-binding protein
MKHTTKVLGIGILAAAVFLSCLTSCEGKNAGGTAGGSSSGVPTLVWWQIGSTQTGFDQHLKTISDYTQEKIGVRVEIKQAGWGDAGQRFNTMVNAGEYFDILFTDAGTYNRFTSLGAFADLTDLLSSDAPALLNAIPELLWKGVTIKDRIFAVPTYKDSAATIYQFWDDRVVQKYGLDLSAASWAQVDANLRKIKEGEGQRYYPMILARGENLFIFQNYDSLMADLFPLGVRRDDASRRVVNTLEQPDVLEAMGYLHSWYEAEIINPDANMVDETPKYRPFFMSQAWPSVASSYATSAGIEKYDALKFFGPSYSTDSIQGSMNAISTNSRYKKEALKLLELVNTDSKFRDMIAYGIEGLHFHYVNDGAAVHRDRSDWPLVNYQEGSFFTETPEDTVPSDYWDEVRKLNESAAPSIMLGFMMDIESVQSELMNCRTAWQKYYFDLKSGASDPAVTLPRVIAELKNAGFDKVLAEAQRQVDAYFTK